VVRLLGDPSHICLLVNTDSSSLAIRPGSPDAIMSFQVPDDFLIKHRHFRIYSQGFVQGLMQRNGMEFGKTYRITGVYSERHHAVIFDMKSETRVEIANGQPVGRSEGE
jgi:hypothetical protein